MELRIGASQLFLLFVDGVDVGVDLAQPMSELAFEQRRQDGPEAVEGGDAVFDQGVASVEEFLQLINGLADDGTRLQAERGAHSGEHGGVASIGLGKLPGCFGEATGLARIDLDHGQSGFGERSFEQAMIGAGGFKDDARELDDAQPSDQGAQALGVIGEASRFRRGGEGDIEPIFGNVDADALLSDRSSFPKSSSCLGGVIPGYPSRPLGKERGGQTTKQSFRICAVATHPLSPPA
jgi:hypothetical protein